MNCKNCDAPVSGNFCTQCGQSTKVDRISLPNFIHELSDSLFQINRGLLFSLRELFIRPGASIRDYLNGKRRSHFRPLAYVFTLCTLYFLLSRFLETKNLAENFVLGFSNMEEGTEHAKLVAERLSWFVDHYSYTMLLLVPVSALCSFLSFLGAGYNYLEHLVLNAYITGQQVVFYSVSVILDAAVGIDALSSFTSFLSVAYTFYVFWRFFNKKRWWSVVLRTMFTYFLFMAILTIIVGLLVRP